jgi:two-component system, sensor histidine kinase and response regulator
LVEIVLQPEPVMFTMSQYGNTGTPVMLRMPRVLVVDDDPGSMMLLRRTLGKECDVTTASNGRDALALLETDAFDAVLLDIMMPGMNGLEVLRAIRSSEALADLPVVLISGRHESEDVVEGLQLGANDYISKPVNIPVLRARIHTQLALKQLSDAYKAKIEELREAQEMQERFLRIVSHDLKGPLTNLRMAQYLLRDIVSGNPQGGSILDNIDTTLNDMQELIRIFLDASAYQPGRLTPEIEHFDASDVIQKVAEQYAMSADRKGIRIRYEPVPVMLTADPRFFSQIASNLLSNAIKYSQPHSVVTVWMDTDGAFARFCVADQGPGIPSAERSRLFQMFSKLSTRPTAGESSSGLGLWIVKMLVEAQGGTVGVDCPPEGGSVFYAYLPLSTDP